MRYQIALIAFLLSAPAAAHEGYDYRCCGDNDCAPVADSAVHETGDVVVFRIAPGTHPMWTANQTKPLIVEVERFRIEKRRMDGRWHLCLTSTQYPLCVYPPDRGF